MHDRSSWRLGRRPTVVRLARSDRLRIAGSRRPHRLGELLADPSLTLPLAVDVKDGRAIAQVVDALRAARALGSSRVWCRSTRAVAWAAQVAAPAEIALLRNTRGAAATMRYLDDASGVGAAAVSLHQDAVTAAVVARAHSLGLVAYAWVVQADGHARVLAAGVDGVVTDWPRIALAELLRQGERC